MRSWTRCAARTEGWRDYVSKRGAFDADTAGDGLGRAAAEWPGSNGWRVPVNASID
jgi:hypothetical protein